MSTIKEPTIKLSEKVLTGLDISCKFYLAGEDQFLRTNAKQVMIYRAYCKIFDLYDRSNGCPHPLYICSWPKGESAQGLDKLVDNKLKAIQEVSQKVRDDVYVTEFNWNVCDINDPETPLQKFNAIMVATHQKNYDVVKTIWECEEE